jgi:hypothetical protein
VHLSWSRERQEEEAWKRSTAVVAAALEEGGLLERRDDESVIQEMHRADQGYQSAFSIPWLAQISEPP